MTPIEPHPITHIQPLHRPAQVRVWSLHQQMIMIAHHHIGMKPHAIPPYDLLQQFQKMPVIAVVPKQLPTLGAP